MKAYIIRRVLISIMVIFLVSLIVFLFMRLLPGDPLIVYLGPELDFYSDADKARLMHEYGLDRPMLIQYGNWLNALVHGDLGRSIIANAEVSYLIKHKLPITLYLAVLALIFSSILGVSFGITAAVKRGTWIDNLVTVLANFGITVPSFWLGICLIYLFAIILRWLPVSGYTSPFDNFTLSIRQLIMPVFVMSMIPIASLARQTRSQMLEVISQDYIRTAWSKGLRERAIIYGHALKNALIPVVTLLGVHISRILGGSIIIETIFNIPGMGRLMVTSVFSLDYQVVQAGVLLTGVIVLVANLLTDISYAWLDPRIKYE